MLTKTSRSMDRATITIAIAIFIALIVEGICIQMISLVLPVLKDEFKISDIMVGSIGSYVFIGMGIGSFIVGWLADRIGRIRICYYSLILFFSMNIILIFSQNYIQFSLMCLLIGFSISGIYSIGTLIVAEYIPTNIRATILGILQSGWSLGYIIAAVSSSYFLLNWGWRQLFSITLIPILIVIYLLRDKEESPSFIASKKENCNKKEGIWKFLLGNINARRTFIIWSITLIALQFGYYGITTWLPSYLIQDLGVGFDKMGIYTAGMYVSMILGKILTGWLSDIFKRKSLWLITNIATAVILPFVMYYATIENVLYLMPVFGFFYGAPFAILATFISESFPTNIRGTAVATSTAIAKIGSVLSPLFMGFMAKNYSISYGLSLLGIAYAICGILPTIFIKEKLYDPNSIVT